MHAQLERIFREINEMEITPFGAILDFLIDQGLTKEQAVRWFEDRERPNGEG